MHGKFYNLILLNKPGLAPVIFILFFMLFTAGSISAQAGSIEGMVTDSENGEPLIGVNILLSGTMTGTTTDIDGSYEIKNLTPGIHTLRFSYVSYSHVTISDIEVKPDGKTKIDIQLKTESTLLQEVVISAELLKNNENTILKIQKNANSIMDVVSAELIKKNNSSDGTDVLKRMTGVAISDGKYAYIRGVSDRYNNTMLNGSNLPGTDPEKKSFSYDIIPAAMIENVVTAKTFTPDKPADFTGGLVQITTVEFPSKFFLNFTTSSGYNSNTSLRSSISYEGGEFDFLGIDDGTRKRPGGINETKVVKGNYSDAELKEIGLSFKNNWGTYSKKTPLNSNYRFSIGDKYKFGNNLLGFTGSVTYSNSSENKDYNKTSVTFDGPRYNYSGTSYNNSILWSGMMNTSLKIAQNNKISLKNIYNQSADNDILMNAGDYEYTSQFRKTTALRYVSRSLFSTQLIGEHAFPEFNSGRINWNLNYSTTTRDEPDARAYLYGRDISDASAPLKLLLDQSWTTRFYSGLNDNIYSAGIDFTIRPFSSNKMPELKAGFLIDKKERHFDARIFGFRNLPGGDFAKEDNLLYSSIDQIFQPENFENKFIQVVEITKPSDSYDSDQQIIGSFLMFDAAVLENLKAVGGVRFERSVQNLYSRSETNQPVIISPEYNDWLPALNLNYILNERINIRTAYSKTLARPEFRELAPYSYYDFLTSELVIGNTSLRRTLIDNYDFRFEYYPDLGELFAVSFFYKNFNNPIEQIFAAASGFEAYRSYANVPNARSYGLEFEIRKNLTFISKKLDGLSFVGNLSLIQSRVKLDNSHAVGFAASERPMQGQAEYIMNFGIYYQSEDDGFSGSVVYNKVGDRIAQSGFINAGDIIERPRDQVDLSISKEIFSHISLALTAKDILAQDQVFIQKRPGKDVVESRYKKGQNYSAGISYAF